MVHMEGPYWSKKTLTAEATRSSRMGMLGDVLNSDASRCAQESCTKERQKRVMVEGGSLPEREVVRRSRG